MSPGEPETDPKSEASLSRLRGVPLLTALGERLPAAKVRAELAARLAEALTERLDGGAGDSPLIVEAARLQEIGKLYLEAELLGTDVAALSMEQRDELDRHYEHGRGLAFGAGVSERACEWILEARERWDGSGPGGLRGEEIPYGARVLAVTRTYLDAGAGVDGAAGVIEQAGTGIDPRLAATAAELTLSGGF